MHTYSDDATCSMKSSVATVAAYRHITVTFRDEEASDLNISMTTCHKEGSVAIQVSFVHIAFSSCNEKDHNLQIMPPPLNTSSPHRSSAVESAAVGHSSLGRSAAL